MSKPNIIAGIDETTLNKIVSQAYRAIYPSIFKNTIQVGQFGIESVEFDISTSPIVTINPVVRNNIINTINTVRIAPNLPRNIGDDSILKLTDKKLALLTERVSAAHFTLLANRIAIIVKNKTGGSENFNVNLEATATLSTEYSSSEGNLLTVEIISAKITFNPPNPQLENLLNQCFVPELIDYLNKNLLGPIRIPMLQYESFLVSMPVPVVQNPFFIAYSALGTVQPDIPSPSRWPPNCVFVGADIAVLQAAVNVPFPLGPSKGFDWGLIKGSIGAQIKPPSNIRINNDGGLSASIEADVWAQLTLVIKAGPFKIGEVKFGPKAQATLSATFKPLVDNGKLYLQIQGVPIPTFHFDWGFPGGLDYLLAPIEVGLATALNAALNPLIGNILKLPPIKVYTIPTIVLDFNGKKIKINIDQATTTTQNSLLVVNGQAHIS